MNIGEQLEFEFKQPIIVSKSPSVIYAFQLSNTHSIDKTYNEKLDYSIIVNENNVFISSLISSFCQKCSKYFSKPLDANRLLSRLVHSDYSVNAEEINDFSSEPVIYEWKYTPYRIIISGIEFKIEWCIDQVEIKCLIDIPLENSIYGSDNNDFINSSAIETNNTELCVTNTGKVESVRMDKNELNIEEPPEVQLEEANIPVSDDSAPISIKMDGRSEDYKRLKKAQLRAEMAKFKAESAYAKYVQRWGYLSEDSGSDSE